MKQHDTSHKDVGERDFDAIIVGAGFAGLYMLHRLRDMVGLRATAIEAGNGVGGTWYWNRYPGARCDIPSVHYSYSFSDQIEQEWTWKEKYASQPEILEYLNFVAKKLDLERDIQFNTRITAAVYDEDLRKWRVTIDNGKTIVAKYFISAAGVLSAGNIPKFEGSESFRGETYFTGNWPKDGVDFKGKRVGIIGTGATAMQAIPIIANDAAHLTVFQRSATYAVPLRNELFQLVENRKIKHIYREIRRQAWASYAGVPFNNTRPSAVSERADERERHYEDCWMRGGFDLWLGSYGDILFNKEANETAAAFVRKKIRERVKDQNVAELLCPKAGVSYGTKRQPCETDYFETFNRNNVTLVDVKSNPIEEITPSGCAPPRGSIASTVLSMRQDLTLLQVHYLK